jgi:hypothetical protein
MKKEIKIDDIKNRMRKLTNKYGSDWCIDFAFGKVSGRNCFYIDLYSFYTYEKKSFKTFDSLIKEMDRLIGNSNKNLRKKSEKEIKHLQELLKKEKKKLKNL